MTRLLASRARAARDDRGFTLVELLVTVSIMAVAFVALVGGLGVFFRGVRTQRGTADLDQRLRVAAEQVVDAGYTACATSYTVAPAAGYTISQTVRYWNNDNPATFGSTCTAATDPGVQRVDVTITRTSDGRDDALTVVKRLP